MSDVDAIHFSGGCGDERVRAAVNSLGPAGGTIRLGPDGPDDASMYASDRVRARRAWGWSDAVHLPSNVTLLLDGALVVILPSSCTRPVRPGAFPGAPRGFVQVGQVGDPGVSVRMTTSTASNVRVIGRRGALVDGCAPFYYSHPHICHNTTCHDRIVPAADTKPPAAPGGIGPQLVRVYGASDFELAGLDFEHTASWVAHFVDVSRVHVHKVVIRHAVRDGLHFGPGIVKDVLVREYESECDDNNFALLGTPLYAENVTLDRAVLRNGRTDAIRVGASLPSENPTGRHARASFVRGLRFTHLKAVDLKVVASLGLPVIHDGAPQQFAPISDVLFENVSMSNANESQSGVRLLQLLQPVENLRMRGVLLPQPMPTVHILADHTRAHVLPSRQQLHPLDGLELSAEAPGGGHHRVELNDRAAAYSHIRIGGAVQHCPCTCVLNQRGHFACTLLPATLLVGEASWRAAPVLLLGATQLPAAFSGAGSHDQPSDSPESSPLSAILQAMGLAVAVVAAAASVVYSVRGGRRASAGRRPGDDG